MRRAIPHSRHQRHSRAWRPGTSDAEPTVIDGHVHFWSLASADRGAVCVVGDPAIDRDDDGLVDAHEACLGTTPADADHGRGAALPALRCAHRGAPPAAGA